MRPPTYNGIALGPNSPLVTAAGRRARVEESDVQAAIMEALVGRVPKTTKTTPGRRVPGAGLTGRYPELALVYAINPNKGGNKSVAGRGLAKAMGLLPDMTDLCLPVMRGPFIGLYVEVKREGDRARSSQRALHDLLRAEGQCVVVARGVSEGVAMFTGYLALPKNRVSARPVPRHLLGLATIDERIDRWRSECYELLKAGDND